MDKGDRDLMGGWAGQRFAAPEHVLVRELEGEAVLLDLEREVYFGLDEVATRFWVLLTTSGSVQAAFDAILKEFDVVPEVLEEDLSSLIRELVARGLLEPATE